MVPFRDPLEQGGAFAKHHRVHEQTELIDQVALEQRHRQVGAAQDEQVLARLCFKSLDLFEDILLYQAGILPCDPAERPGKDDLRQAVHGLRRDRISLDGCCGRPEARHQFIGPAPEQEHVGGIQLRDGKLVEFLIHVVPVDGMVWSLEEAIQGHQYGNTGAGARSASAPVFPMKSSAFKVCTASYPHASSWSTPMARCRKQ